MIRNLGKRQKIWTNTSSGKHNQSHGLVSQRICNARVYAGANDVLSWGTVDEKVEENGPIEPDKKREEIRQDPYSLPKEFEWSLIDIEDEAQIKEVYELLSANYVEDDDAMFRFDYSASFLRWCVRGLYE